MNIILSNKRQSNRQIIDKDYSFDFYYSLEEFWKMAYYVFEECMKCKYRI